MIKIHFLGVLGEKYTGTTLDVSTPVEVMGLLEANSPGIRRDMIDCSYVMVIYNPSVDDGNAVAIDHENSNIKIGSDDEVYFVPKPNGEGAMIFLLTSNIVIATGASTTTGYVLAGIAATAIVAAGYIGIAMGLVALADAIMPGLDEGKDDVGHIFSGAVNTSRQGDPVPVCYGGPIRVGSQVISISMSAD